MRTKVEFPSSDGSCLLRGTVYLPDGAGRPVPAVVASHGYGDVAARLVPTAEAFAAAGFGVLVYDHRQLGASGGEPRQEIDPVAQHRDLRTAVTFAESVDGFDAGRIGLWGTSFSGAHVLTAAAWDKRVKAVVSQVPWISGYDNGLRLGGQAGLQAFDAMLHAEQQRLLQGEKPSLSTLGRRTDDPSEGFALFTGDEGYDYLMNGPVGVPDTWQNSFTTRSLAYALEYDVRPLAARVSPTPLMMILAREDHDMPIELGLEFFQAAHEPKELVLVPGGHYDTYLPQGSFGQVTDAAIRWFQTHL